MLIDIAFFDQYVDEDTLRNILKVDFEVISKQPCFSSYIRLRKKRKQVYTFYTKKYKSNILRFSFGMLFRLHISEEDSEWIDIIMSSNGYEKDVIPVTTIETTYEQFINNKYKVIGKSKAICYTAEVSDLYKSLYKNRHLVVDFHKSLLINLL